MLMSGPWVVGGQAAAPAALCHHVLLALVEPHLAERYGAHRHVDACSDEAVEPDLVVEAVDVLRGIFTVVQKRR